MGPYEPSSPPTKPLHVSTHRNVLGADAVGLGHGADVVLPARAHHVALGVQDASRLALIVL